MCALSLNSHTREQRIHSTIPKLVQIELLPGSRFRPFHQVVECSALVSFVLRVGLGRLLLHDSRAVLALFVLPLARDLGSARVEPRSLAPHLGEPAFGLRRAEFRHGVEAEAGRAASVSAAGSGGPGRGVSEFFSDRA